MSEGGGEPARVEPGFSLIQGGPLHSLLGRVGLLDENGLPTPRAASRIAGSTPLIPVTVLRSIGSTL